MACCPLPSIYVNYDTVVSGVFVLSGQTVNIVYIFIEVGKGQNKDSQMSLSSCLIIILCCHVPISSEISKSRVIAKITFI